MLTENFTALLSSKHAHMRRTTAAILLLSVCVYVCGERMAHYSVHKPGQLNILAGGKQVVVTPLSQAFPRLLFPKVKRIAPNHVGATMPAAAVIDKVLIKVFPKGNKESKTFTLRYIDTKKVCSCDQLKSEIRTQLKSDVSGNVMSGIFRVLVSFVFVLRVILRMFGVISSKEAM